MPCHRVSAGCTPLPLLHHSELSPDWSPGVCLVLMELIHRLYFRTGGAQEAQRRCDVCYCSKMFTFNNKGDSRSPSARSHQTNEHLTHPNLYLPTLSTVASVIDRFTSDLLCCAITGNQYEKVVTSGARCEPLLTPVMCLYPMELIKGQ